MLQRSKGVLMFSIVQPYSSVLSMPGRVTALAASLAISAVALWGVV